MSDLQKEIAALEAKAAEHALICRAITAQPAVLLLTIARPPIYFFGAEPPFKGTLR